MQQRRFQQTCIRTQVEFDLQFQILWFQACLPLPCGQVARKGVLRNAFADLAHAFPDVQLALQHRQWNRITVAHCGQRGLAHFGDARHRKIAHRGQPESQPSRFYGRGRWGRITLFAELEGRARLPYRSKLLCAGQFLARVKRPQVAIPSGRDHSGTVSGEGAETTVGPRHPCRFDLYARQVFDQCAVVRRLRRLAQSADMPSASDHGDISFELFQCRSYVRAYEGFPLKVAICCFRQWHVRIFVRTCLCHCRLDRCEYRERLLSAGSMLFDHAIPEGLAVFISCRSRE